MQIPWWLSFIIWALTRLGFLDRAQRIWERERDLRKKQADVVAQAPKTAEELDKWLRDGKY